LNFEHCGRERRRLNPTKRRQLRQQHDNHEIVVEADRTLIPAKRSELMVVGFQSML
jgi:hypothetical protein